MSWFKYLNSTSIRFVMKRYVTYQWLSSTYKLQIISHNKLAMTTTFSHYLNQ